MPTMIGTRALLQYILLPCLLTLALSACSTPTRKSSAPARQATASEDISPEERMRLDALERYRQLREKTWQQYTRARPTVRPQVPKPKPKQMPTEEPAVAEEMPTPTPEAVETPPAVSPEKLQEWAMISEQLTSYECIKRRLSQDACQELTSMLKQACPIDGSMKQPVDCIKKNLKAWR